MAKNCLKKLASNILQDCAVSQVGIKDIYLMHVEDVKVVLGTEGYSVTSVTFASGAKSYKVEGYKQNIQYTASLKTTDTSAKLNTSISFKMRPMRNNLQPLAMGRFYVMAIIPDGSGMFMGALSPLECSAMDYDSNANTGLVTVTLSDPEGSAGNHHMSCINAVRDLIISKSV